jgi:2-polyprenyl-3-methyl-5-hydroxy-6-metoxy-1,4-benzoquinol methylase
MDYERLYAYRFRNVDQQSRLSVWRAIAPHVYRLMGSPDVVLDPAAGRGEFIGSIPARERWAVDEVAYQEAEQTAGVNVVTSRIMDAELPSAHFDGVFASNFLEHLFTQEAVYEFLVRMRDVMAPGGRIAIMGPNIRYCAKDYWDMADHYVPLTHLAVAEHLAAAGFEPEKIVPRYLPYSFNGILPPSPALTRAYLRLPLAWKLLGKQFLVIGRN